MEEVSFTDGLSGYHHIRIHNYDRNKTTFIIEWGSFQYMVMPFGLKNAPAIFSRVVVVVFKEYIHKCLEVYFDDYKIYVLAHERPMILVEAHASIEGGHYSGRLTIYKVLTARLWWPTLHKDAKEFCRNCDV